MAEEALVPRAFSAFTRPDWWTNISTLYLRLEGRKDWFCLRRMLAQFDHLKSLSLFIRLHGAWKTSAVSMPLLRPLDFLSLSILDWCTCNNTAPVLPVKAILSSWSQMKRLHLEFDGFSSKVLSSSGFFGDRFPLKEAVPAGLGLEEFLFGDIHWPTKIVPKEVISSAAWQ